MSRAAIERRLRRIGDQARALREELAVVNEQLEHLTTEADDARLRALVSETPIADHERRDAERHASAMARQREHLVEEIARLEKAQDDLLDRLVAETR